jgi:hypothetical protein
MHGKAFHREGFGESEVIDFAEWDRGHRAIFTKRIPGTRACKKFPKVSAHAC